MEQKTKIVFSPKLARKLLKMDNHMIDIKPDRNKEGATVFVFEATDKFLEDMNTVITAMKEEKTTE